MALIVAMLAILMMTLLPLALAAQATGQLTLARSDQNHEAALAAANAGAEDFILRLNANNNYWNNSSGTTWTGNYAFSKWVQVPGTSTEWYWYWLNKTATGCGNPAKTGIVCISASGCASARPVSSSTPTVCPSGQVRTVNYSLKAKGFLNYIYTTQYEVEDPALVNGGCTPEHAYDSTANTCPVVWFSDNNVINGPLHSDDALHICGAPTFNGAVDTYYNSGSTVPAGDSFGQPGQVITGQNCTDGATFAMASGSNHQPAAGTTVDPPSTTTSQLDAAADPSQGGHDGCVFPNSVTLALYKTSSGTGTVAWSSSPSPVGTSTWNSSLCGGSSGATSGTVAIPASGLVIYSGQQVNVSNSGAGNTPSGATPGLLGQLSVAAANNIVVTGNLTYMNGLTGSDVLGLIANQFVDINQPNSQSPVCIGTGTAPNCTLTVQAAILAANDSFTVNSYNQGSPLGTLQINGAIAQKYRGPVGTLDGQGNIASGYAKNYVYDSRLQYLTPPYWPSPTSATWTRSAYMELPACSIAGSSC